MELDRGDNITAEYIRGLNIDTPLAMRQGRNNYYYHRNHQGSIIALSDSTGSIVQRYAYDSFCSSVINHSHI